MYTPKIIYITKYWIISVYVVLTPVKADSPVPHEERPSDQLSIITRPWSQIPATDTTTLIIKATNIHLTIW